MAAARRPPPPPEECAQCGAPIPPRARACPGCGADERTGWRETSVYDGLELPDSAWSGDDEAPDAGSPAPARPTLRRTAATGVAWYWWAVALFLLFAFGFAVLGLG